MKLCRYLTALIFHWKTWIVLAGKQITVELTQKSLVATTRLSNYIALLFTCSLNHVRQGKAYPQLYMTGHQSLAL